MICDRCQKPVLLFEFMRVNGQAMWCDNMGMWVCVTSATDPEPQVHQPRPAKNLREEYLELLADYAFPSMWGVKRRALTRLLRKKLGLDYGRL